VFDSVYQNRPVVYKLMKHAMDSGVFMKEIEILHNIPTFLGYSIQHHRMIIIMEKAEGITRTEFIHYDELDDMVKRGLLLDLSRVLHYLHHQLILYGDLKPENIMIHPTRHTLSLIDFGLSVRLSSPYATIEDQRGTPGYMAPEIMEGKPHGLPADIFALGRVFFCAADRAPSWQARSHDRSAATPL